jgi:hypothetical protein
MSFGGLPFARGHARITQEMYQKYTRNTTIQIPNMSLRGEGPHNQAKQGPKQVENKPKTNSNHPNFTPNHYGPSSDDHRRLPTEEGLLEPSHGVATPPGSFEDQSSWATPYRLYKDSYGGLAVQIMLRMMV